LQHKTVPSKIGRESEGAMTDMSNQDRQARDGTLQPADTDLLKAARQVRERAYAPYSNFKVGAAIRGASGQIYQGCNVENVAYPEGTCAEAGAIAAMIAAGETQLTAVCVIADSPAPTPPCGGCRQKLAEFGAPATPVLLASVAGALDQTSIGELLPGRFGRDHMTIPL